VGERHPLTAAGRTTTIHLARPTGTARSGVVLLHPWWGLTDDTIDVAERLASAGFVVGAPDLYAGPIATTIDEAERLSSAVDESAADAWALAAADAVLRLLDATEPRIATVGFSFGVPWAVWLAAQRPHVAATVAYYGTTAGPSIVRGSAPVLGHFAEDDPYEPAEGVDAFESALRRAGREVEFHRYPGTGHWFAEPSRDAHDPVAASTALERTIRFLEDRLLPVASPAA
jgi:carboxymethylenebutenolidase